MGSIKVKFRLVELLVHETVFESPGVVPTAYQYSTTFEFGSEVGTHEADN